MSEQSPIYYQRPMPPEVDEILSSPCASAWLKDALRAALSCDAATAAAEAEQLALALRLRASGAASAGGAGSS